MPTPICSICTHPHRAKLELGLARGVSVPALARKFGAGTDALYRHRRNHLPADLLHALRRKGRPTEIDLEALRREEAEGLVQDLVAQKARLSLLIDQCLEFGDVNACIGAHGRYTRLLELEAKLVGELSTHALTVHQNVFTAPVYIEVRAAIVEALADHPAARQAVVTALRSLESETVADELKRVPAGLIEQATEAQAGQSDAG